MLTQKNYMKLEFPARSVNEGFARAAVAAFAAQLDPTLDELGGKAGSGRARKALV